MAISVESSTPETLNKEPTRCTSSSPATSPSSDKLFWSALRNRIGTILDNRNSSSDLSTSTETQLGVGRSDRAQQMKEDSLLLLKGFDSVAHSLSQLSNHLDNALHGARDLAKSPTMTEIYQSAMETTKRKGEEIDKVTEESGDDEETQKGLKRKFKEQQEEGGSQEVDLHNSKHEGNFKKAKNLAISMATKAASLARELKSIKSDLSFMQERCDILEEENRRLRDGFGQGIRPEEDDLVRLQLEALLAEKSRLATENANLTRENQCLHQLVEYHQLTSQDDLSVAYDDAIRGLTLDFSSPPPSIQEEEDRDRDSDSEVPRTPRANLYQDEHFNEDHTES